MSDLRSASRHEPRTTSPPLFWISDERLKRWYFPVAAILLLIGAFFRVWHLGTVPPGLSASELINAQIADGMWQGRISVLYDAVLPAREGLLPALLAGSVALTGRGLILWRLPVVWISMLSLAMTTTLMRRLFGMRVALMTLGLMAVTFWPVLFGRTVIQAALMPLLTTFVFYCLTRALLSGDQRSGGVWFTAGGLGIGVAQYAHISAWTLMLIPTLFIGYRLIFSKSTFRRHWSSFFYVLMLALLTTLPLMIFTLNHPGVRTAAAADQPTSLADIPVRMIGALSGLILRGDIYPEFNLPGRPALGPATGILMLIGVGIAIARWRRSSYALLLGWLLVGLIPSAWSQRSPNFEAMVVILPAVFAFPAITLQTLHTIFSKITHGHERVRRVQVIALMVVAILGANTIWTFYDYFERWPLLGDVCLDYQADLGLLAHFLDTTHDPAPVSICVKPLPSDAGPFDLSNDQLLGYFMHRTEFPLNYFDCSQSLLLINGGETQRLIFPRGHYYDSLPGPLLAWMRYATDEQPAGIRPDVVMRLNSATQIADQAGAFITTAPVAWPPESGEFRLALLPVPFENNVTFLGYTIRDTVLHPGDYVELTTFWRLDGPPPPSATLFVHLLGSPVVVLAQSDILGVDISSLHTRDVFMQYTLIQVPKEITPGLYPLSVGLYIPGTSQRLQVYEEGTPRGNRLFLQRITIEKAIP
jgi:hypothetical protein